jgi:hypothetical protein
VFVSGWAWVGVVAGILAAGVVNGSNAEVQRTAHNKLFVNFVNVP